MTTSTIAIGKILSVLLEKTQITEAHLARMIGMPRATINKIHSGKILDPKSSTLNLIANYFGITVDQLIGNTPLLSNNVKKFIHIPVINPQDLIFPQHIFNKINFTNHNNWMLFGDQNRLNNNSISIFATILKSDAMLPYFDDKTTLIIDRLLPIINRKYVLAYIMNNNEVVLRQIFIDGSKQILKPLNQKFETLEITASDRIIGTLVQTKKEF